MKAGEHRGEKFLTHRVRVLHCLASKWCLTHCSSRLQLHASPVGCGAWLCREADPRVRGRGGRQHVDAAEAARPDLEKHGARVQDAT